MLVKQKQCIAMQCPVCNEWILLGWSDKKPIALNAWSMTEHGSMAAYRAGIKLWVVNEVRELYGPVRPRFDWVWPKQEWKAQHGCPIEQVVPQEATGEPWSPPCEPPGTIPPATCTRTPEARESGAVSCDGCEPVPFDRSVGELLVSELGATVLMMEIAGRNVYDVRYRKRNP